MGSIQPGALSSDLLVVLSREYGSIIPTYIIFSLVPYQEPVSRKVLTIPDDLVVRYTLKACCAGSGVKIITSTN